MSKVLKEHVRLGTCTSSLLMELRDFASIVKYPMTLYDEKD
jgi:homoaconitase/3-isopropylmalate dehydratase large subunit